MVKSDPPAPVSSSGRVGAWLIQNPDGVFSDDMEPTGLHDIVEG